MELQIQFSAVQKVLATQMFANEGRFYVRGDAQEKCSYAFLENPTVDGLEGAIQIRARFQGRNGTNIFGLCLGPGDTFDLKILAAPYFDTGSMRLREVRVESGTKNGFYARRVREAIQKDLPAKFEFKVDEEAKRLLENKKPNEPYQQQLTKFQISSIRVTPQALVLSLDFTLVVK